MPHQLIYASASSTPMQADDLEDLLERAQHKNAAAGITGALVYVDGCFLQVLEGLAEPVRQLMERIYRDPRHEAVTLLQAQEVAEARFAQWTMAYVSATSAQVAQWAGLSERTELPETVAQMREDRDKAMLALNSILLVLTREPGAVVGSVN